MLDMILLFTVIVLLKVMFSLILPVLSSTMIISYTDKLSFENEMKILLVTNAFLFSFCYTLLNLVV